MGRPFLRRKAWSACTTCTPSPRNSCSSKSISRGNALAIAPPARVKDSSSMSYTIQVNGKEHSVDAEGDTPLQPHAPPSQPASKRRAHPDVPERAVEAERTARTRLPLTVIFAAGLRINVAGLGVGNGIGKGVENVPSADGGGQVLQHRVRQFQVRGVLGR